MNSEVITSMLPRKKSASLSKRISRSKYYGAFSPFVPEFTSTPFAYLGGGVVIIRNVQEIRLSFLCQTESGYYRVCHKSHACNEDPYCSFLKRFLSSCNYHEAAFQLG